MSNVSLRRTSRWLATAGAAAAVSALSLLAGTSDAVFEHRVADAAVTAGLASRIAKAAPKDGTEDYWLGLKPAIALTPVSADQTLTVGRGLPKGVDAAGRDLEIVSIRRIEDDGREQLLLVTCRDRRQGDDSRVKFLIQMPASAQTEPRSL